MADTAEHLSCFTLLKNWKDPGHHKVTLQISFGTLTQIRSSQLHIVTPLFKLPSFRIIFT